MTAQQRAQRVEKAMREVWASLESHLPYASARWPSTKPDNVAFHRKTVKRYAKLLKVISDLY